ncbi:hypothetical protein Tco_1032428 [Tanacetum coccineum]|uniref:Uncharacterized protein n=1 Tax=Tanacetum coccineum TaxID=301880 RepID=A0ABQ5GBT3_9ASTR
METKDTLSSCSNSEEQQMQQIQDKAKKSCMVSFRKLHSHLKHLSQDNLKGTRIESGFKRAFGTLFGQDVETFIGTMFLNVDQLEKQLDKEEFQEIGSIASFKVLETQFQMFIKSRMYLDDEFVVMTCNYFLQYTQLTIPEFRDTLIQHMESVKKSIDERAQHKRDIGTESKEQDTSSKSGNDAHADDAHIRPIYDEEPMVETTRAKNIELTTSLIAKNDEFKAQLQEKGENALQPRRNHQLLGDNDWFKFERPRFSKLRVAPKYSTNDMIHNHTSGSEKKTQEAVGIQKPSVMLLLVHKARTVVAILKLGSVETDTGKIFKTVGLRWVPTGKIFTSSTTKVDSEPTNGSNEDITNQYECEQTLDVSAGTLNLSAEQVENGIIELYFVRTEYQLADMFTKALPEERFQYLVRRIGMRCLTPAELEKFIKVVRLAYLFYDPTRTGGIYPRDNFIVEIAVLRGLKNERKCKDKGSKEEPSTQLRQKPGQYICCQNHNVIADIEDDTSWNLVIAMHNPS